MEPSREPPARTDAADAGAATHLFLGLCVALCLAFGVWAYFGKLDVVSVAIGEVVPSSRVKSVQHLEGGIVREILVREGDRVEQGVPLVVLESTTSAADVGELESRLTSLGLEIARLEAQIAGKATPEFDAEIARRHPNQVRAALELFQSRRKRIANQISTHEEAGVQRQQDINEITVRIANSRNSLELQREQVSISEDLLKQDLTNRYNHLDLLKEASHLEGRIKEDGAALKRAKAAWKEARARLEGARNGFAEEVKRELESARRSHQELSQRMLKFADSLRRTIVRSPVDGIVKTLYVATVGGVVKPGNSVADIVPAGDRLVVEARLPTQDIGYVSPGQTVLVKLASADAMRFGGLEGTVVNISPDTLTTQDGVPYYKIRIETGRDRFERGRLQYRLFPGMQVIASIQTGTRTVLEYIFDPFLNAFGDALRER